MALTLTVEAELRLLRGLLGQPLTVRLFGNDVRPTRAGGSLVEVSGGGYAPRRVGVTAWRMDTEDGDMGAISETQTFGFTGEGPTVYGYYVTPDDDASLVLMAERLDLGDVPLPLRPRANDSLEITIRCGVSGRPRKDKG